MVPDRTQGDYRAHRRFTPPQVSPRNHPSTAPSHASTGQALTSHPQCATDDTLLYSQPFLAPTVRLDTAYRHAYTLTVSPKKSTALRLDVELLNAMGRIRKAEGIPVTTQIEFAVREWLEARGSVKPKRESKP